VTTIAIRIYNEKYLQSLGLAKLEQLWLLADAVKTGTLPVDEQLQHALPAFLTKRIQAIQMARKKFSFNVAVFTLALLGSLIGRNWLFVGYCCVFLAVVIWSTHAMKKTEANIMTLQAKLNALGIKVDVETDALKADDRKRLQDQRNKNDWLV
jgi:hypothetical protein